MTNGKSKKYYVFIFAPHQSKINHNNEQIPVINNTAFNFI